MIAETLQAAKYCGDAILILAIIGGLVATGLIAAAYRVIGQLRNENRNLKKLLKLKELNK